MSNSCPARDLSFPCVNLTLNLTAPMNDDETMKQGYKTTEFWLTLATKGVALCAAMGWIAPAQQGQYAVVLEAAIQIIGLVLFGVSSSAYAVSRGLAKSKPNKGGDT